MKRPSSKIDDALNVLAAALGGAIQHGTEIHGRLLESGGELEVEVTLRVKRRTSSTENTRHRAQAMALLAAEAWRDRCPCWVKSRTAFSFQKEKPCAGKVTTVIVRSSHADMVGPLRPGEYRPQLPAERFEFVCSHHADVVHPDVIAVVRLDPAALRTLRANRQREADERAAHERAKERELEAEVRTLSDDALARRLAEFVAAHQWGAEDICLREQRRRAAKPAVLPVCGRSA